MSVSIFHIGLSLDHPSIPLEERSKIKKRLHDLQERMTRAGYNYEIIQASPETGLDGFNLIWPASLYPGSLLAAPRLMPDTGQTGTRRGAVFLSYASQDAEAAKRICEALRAAGIEVWFDQSELRGGDAWDQSIRKQIKDCALFMPVISEHTQARAEGYFRLEWRLADQRTHLMGRLKPFLVPVCIDGTRDADADVPDSFAAVQWTRLPGGETAPLFCERVTNLLAGLKVYPGRQSPVTGSSAAERHPTKISRPWLIPAIVGVIVCAALALWQPWRKAGKLAAPAPVATPVSDALQLVQRAGAIWENIDDLSSEKLGAAEELYTRALMLDPTDAEVWAAAARLDAWTAFLGFDQSEGRRQKAQKEAARGVALAPNSFAARHAQACVLAFTGGSTATLGEAEKIYTDLMRERQDDKLLVREFGIVLRNEGRNEEAGALFAKYGFIEEAGWNYFKAGRYDDAVRTADKTLAQHRTMGALELKCRVELTGFEDLAAAQATVDQYTPAELLLDGPVLYAAAVSIYRREPDAAIRALCALPREFVTIGNFDLPKRYMLGIAYQIAGRDEAARSEWRIALQQTQERLKTRANDPGLLSIEAEILACLGETEDAGRVLRLYQSISGLGPNSAFDEQEAATLVRLGRKEEVLTKLSRALNAKGKDWHYLHAAARFEPDFDPLRGDPRFEKLLRDTLPPYAKPFDEFPTKVASAPEPGHQ